MSLPSPARSRRLWGALLLAAALAAALLLRAPHLGELGYAWDEDISALAAQGIREASLPVLPSGRIYARALPYSYACAAFLGLTGDAERDLRLPGLVCSLLSLILVALLGREWGDGRAGLLAAALGAVSLWELALARNARMYPMLASVVLAFLLAWSRGHRRGSRSWQATAILLLGLAVLVHDLAATLAVVYLFPMWERWRGDAPAAGGGKPWRPWPSLALAGLTAAVAVAVPRLVSATVGRHFDTLAHHAGSLGGRSMASLPAALAELLQLPVPALWARPGGVPLAALALVAGLACVAAAWRRRLLPAPRGLSLAVALLVALSLAAHQAVPAALGVWVLAARSAARGGEAPGRWWLISGGAALVAVLSAAWGMFGVVTDPGGIGAGALHETLLAMTAIPRRFWWLLAELFPVLFLLAVAVPAGRLLGRRCPGPVRFLAFVVLASLLALGMGASPSWSHRYIAHLNLVLLLLVSFQVVAAWDRLRAARPRMAPGMRRLVGAALAAACLLLVLDVSPPGRIRDKLNQSYAAAVPEVLGGPWEGFPFYPDERSPALYVADHRAPGDRVVAMNWLSFAAYAGPADDWLRSSGYEVQVYSDRDGALRDVYTGAKLIADAAGLRRLLQEYTGDGSEAAAAPGAVGRLWVVTSGLEVARGKRVTPEMMALLAAHEDRVAHVAADRRGKVYLFQQEPGPGSRED